MTDNTQELDELRRLLFKRTTNDWYYNIDTQEVPQASIHIEAVESMLTRVLDWHNKQIEAVLDELKEEGISCIDPAGHPTYVVPLSAIEAERARLGEDS